MNYGQIKQGAVPHVTTLGNNFQIDYQKYQFSLVIESSYILLLLPLLAIRIYFSSKYKESKTKKNGDPESQQESIKEKRRSANTEQDGFTAKSQEMEYMHGNNFNKTNTTTFKQKAVMENQFDLDTVERSNDKQSTKKLEAVERKLCYGACYFILHVVVVNSFDVSPISFGTFYIGYVVYIIFNLARPKKNAFLEGLFIIPSVLASLPFWLGKHHLGDHTS